MAGFLKTVKNVFSKGIQDSIDVDVPNSINLETNDMSPEVEIIKSAGSWDNYKYSIDFDSTSSTVNQLVEEYRNIAQYPEIDEAIVEIVNESIVQEGESIVKIKIESDEIKKNIKEKIEEEFKHIISLMNFNDEGDKFFRQWYEDGRLYIHGVIDLNKIKDGIQNIKVLSPYYLRQVREDGKLFFIFKIIYLFSSPRIIKYCSIY